MMHIYLPSAPARGQTISRTTKKIPWILPHYRHGQLFFGDLCLTSKVFPPNNRIYFKKKKTEQTEHLWPFPSTIRPASLRPLSHWSTSMSHHRPWVNWALVHFFFRGGFFGPGLLKFLFHLCCEMATGAFPLCFFTSGCRDESSSLKGNPEIHREFLEFSCCF